MSGMLQYVFAELEPKVLYIIICIFIVLLILAILKKAVKLAILIGVIAGCIFVLAPIAKDFQERYTFTMESDRIIVKVDGQEYTIDDISNIKEAKIIHNNENTIDVELKYVDNRLTFNMPLFMEESLRSFLEQYSIAYTVE